MNKKKADQIKDKVKEVYGGVATQSSSGCGCSCGCGPTATDVSKGLGYSDQEVGGVPEANLGLGCGNPTALGKIKEGETVLDLGSGAGIDCFIAAKKVGPAGKVIGVDMTKPMIEKARANAKKHGYANVEFRLGDIEELPVDENSVDVIISNCVINIAPDKLKVFQGARKALKKGGRMYISDIVLLKEIPQAKRDDLNSIAGCVGGAMLRGEYIKLLEKAGFKVNIISENKEISPDLPIASLNFEAVK